MVLVQTLQNGLSYSKGLRGDHPVDEACVLDVVEAHPRGRVHNVTHSGTFLHTPCMSKLTIPRHHKPNH